jgi:mxaJ protein
MKRLLLSAVLLALDGKPERVLRVCADPASATFDLEARIADVVAKDMDARVEHTMHAQRRGFFRNTLNAKTCDVVVGVPVGIDMARTTKPYYRSTFVFVARSDAPLADVRSIDDPRLQNARIGVPIVGDDGANPGPVHALARRGIVAGLKGYHVYADHGRVVPAIADAVMAKDVDVGILWGPIAAHAKKKLPLLVISPIAEREDEGLPFTFAIGMGVRRGDAELARELDGALVRRRSAIADILAEAGVPRIETKEGP